MLTSNNNKKFPTIFIDLVLQTNSNMIIIYSLDFSQIITYKLSLGWSYFKPRVLKGRGGYKAPPLQKHEKNNTK